jgi:hypothetical protein
MLTRYGRCTNFDECDNATHKDGEPDGQVFDIQEGLEFLCPKCGRELTECSPEKKKRHWLQIAVFLGLLLACVGVGMALFFTTEAPKPVPSGGGPPIGVPPTNKTEDVAGVPPTNKTEDVAGVPPTNKTEDVVNNPNVERDQDVVFLMSLSATIGGMFLPDSPNILSEGFSGSDGLDRLGLSLWGFRGPGPDNALPVEINPIVRPWKRLEPFLQDFKATKFKITENSWKDDSFQAVDRVVVEAGWRANSVRWVVVVTDSSSPASVGKADERALREKADSERVRVAVIHVLNRHVVEDHALAERQYKVLANNTKVGGILDYYPVREGKTQADNYQVNYSNQLKALIRSISQSDQK